MAGVADGNGDGEDEREGEAADFGSSAKPEPTSRKMANTQTLNSIAANGGDITTPREFWLASCLAEPEGVAQKVISNQSSSNQFRKPVEPARVSGLITDLLITDYFFATPLARLLSRCSGGFLPFSPIFAPHFEILL
jgi:hypothetical protein